jgi:hypothetical protein
MFEIMPMLMGSELALKADENGEIFHFLEVCNVPLLSSPSIPSHPIIFSPATKAMVCHHHWQQHLIITIIIIVIIIIIIIITDSSNNNNKDRQSIPSSSSSS